MKKYAMLVTIEVELGEFEDDQSAAEAGDEATNEFMDAYIVDNTELYEVDDDGVRIRGVEWS